MRKSPIVIAVYIFVTGSIAAGAALDVAADDDDDDDDGYAVRYADDDAVDADDDAYTLERCGRGAGTNSDSRSSASPSLTLSLSLSICPALPSSR